MNYKALLEYAKSKSEKKYLKALIENKTQEQAAKALGINLRSLTRALSKVKAKAVKQGFSPEHDMTHTAPEGFGVKGVSTYYDEEGNVRGQWVKTQADHEKQLEIFKETIESFIEDIPKAKPIKTPKITAKDLLVAYPMGDPHIGMYAWAEECGDDFDTDIAERNLCEAVKRLVECAPNAETGVLINVGDFFHADSLENKTMRSGHNLDVDTRWPRVLRIGINIMRTCIESGLKKHKKIKVINAIGNHDDHTSVMLSIVLNAYYEKEKRVEIDMSPSWFHYIEFGNNLIGVTHGDKVKAPNLPQLMATDKSEEWGRTKYRYWYTGHIHHDTLKEFAGCKVESFRTLAAKDAYAASHGYRAGRDMQCIIHHKDFGEIERHRINIDMI